jgi:hypothetical protein
VLPARQLPLFRRWLGDAVGRVFADGDGQNAQRILDRAEAYLIAHSRERVRFWYVSAATATTAVFAVLGVVMWLSRAQMRLWLEPNGFEILLGTASGSIGALISAISRKTADGDASSGARDHLFEGAARVLLGMAGAFLVAVAVKANLVVGFVNAAGAATLPLLIVLCVIAGASERLVPTLIAKLEQPPVAGADEP